jgi:hypothetical protein
MQLRCEAQRLKMRRCGEQSKFPKILQKHVTRGCKRKSRFRRKYDE